MIEHFSYVRLEKYSDAVLRLICSDLLDRLYLYPEERMQYLDSVDYVCKKVFEDVKEL